MLRNMRTRLFALPTVMHQFALSTVLALGGCGVLVWCGSANGQSGYVYAWGDNNDGQLGNGTTTNSSSVVQVTGLSGVTSVAGGGFDSLALTSAGTVYAWGYNSYGQLGNGTTTSSSTPVQVTGLSNVSALASGQYQSLALTASGTVYAWGYNADGELGNGTTTNSSIPAPVSALSGVSVTAVAGGLMHSLVLTSAGTVYAWGNNSYGQLGNGTTTNSSAPVQVTGVSGFGVTAVAAGGYHSLALTAAGTVYAWGYNAYGQLGNGTTGSSSAPVQVTGLPSSAGVTAIAGGEYDSLALTSAGTVYAWGYNNFGQLGNGTTTNSSTPLQVTGLANVVKIAASSSGSSSYALEANGTLWAWGYNGNGQLGNGNTTNQLVTVQINPPPGYYFSGIAAAGSHGLASTQPVSNGGSVFAWGANLYGELGNGTSTGSSTPVQASGLSGISAVAGGQYHSLALTASGTVYAWGYNRSGQLGNGTTTSSSAPVQVNGLSSISAVAAGGNHSLALTASGAVYAWGYNGDGELGNGTTANSSTPVQVNGLSSISAVAAGGGHSLALTSAGTVYAWGYNNEGQLGNGTTTNSSTPVQVTGLSGITAIAGGYFHSLALTASGTVYAWGYNGYGELGNGTTTNSSTPVLIGGLSGVTAVAAGIYTSLALTSAGTVYAWGYNIDGQLGNGTTNGSATPVLVTGLSNVVKIAMNTTGASGTSSYALEANGTLWAWGYNRDGEIGNGTTTNQLVPVQINAPTGYSFSGIAAGGQLALAIVQPQPVSVGGSVFAWGYNGDGELGNGTTVSSTTPVQVTGLSGVTALAGGGYHSLALTTAGTVYAWAYNGDGALGNGTTTNSLTPVQVTGLSGVTAIAAGEYHSLALTAAGTVYAWGYNGDGELGNGQTTNSSTPVLVTGLSGVTAIAGGGNHSVAVTAAGTVYAWGSNSHGQLGNGTTTSSSNPVQVTGLSGVTGVAAGLFHTLALTAAGTVYAWGNNADGELGNGQTTNSATPVQVTGLSGVTGIAGGGHHSMALTAAGTVYAWGSNSAGQLGNGTTTSSSVPVQVIGLADVVKIAANNDGITSYALEANGTMWAWGYNGDGEFGNGTTTNSSIPVEISAPAGFYFSSIAAGASHALVLTQPVSNGGAVCATGNNAFGQLGNGTTTSSPTAVQVAGLSGVTAVAVGGSHGLALTYSGTVYAWGNNGSGQLGNGTTMNSSTPVQVSGLSNISAVAAGQSHSLALTAAGTVYAWGLNSSGQLGNGTTSSSSTPVLVSGLPSVGVIAVAGGGDHSLALTTAGMVYAWGLNSNGQLGNGTTTNSSIPVQVSGLSGISAIAGGGDHSLALTAAGTVYAWGLNSNGQLGNGSTTDSHAPALVTALPGVDVTAVAAGADHSLALTSAGTVYAWGFNADGQLGNGLTTNSSTPVQVMGLANVVKIAASSSGNSSYALEANGSLWAWGYNGDAELGDGTTINRLVPVQIGAPSGFYFSAIAAGGNFSLVVTQPIAAFPWIGAVSNLWTTAGNWNANGLVPVSGQLALFNQASPNTTVSLGGTVPIGTIKFDSAACAAYTLGSAVGNGDAFLFDLGGSVNVTVAVTTAQTFNTAIQTQGTLNITNNGTGGLTFNGALTLGNGAAGSVIFAGTGTTVYAGAISNGANGLVQAGPGTLFLTGTNSYVGGTTISSGTLNINSDTALGAASGAVNLSGGTLQFPYAVSVTLNRSRNIVLAGAGGTFDTNSGNDAINGMISGTNLTKIGVGVLNLNNNANTYTGSTTVNAGALYVPSTGNLGTGALIVNNANTTLPGTQTILFLYNAVQIVGSVSGTITDPADGNTAAIFLSPATTLTVNQIAAGTYQGTIFGGGSLALGSSSNNTLTLTGNSIYGGSTTINGGTIQLGVANALPPTTSLTLGSGGTLNLNNNNQTIAALNSSAGNINTGMGTGGILTIGNTAGGTVTYSGVISGPGGLTWGIINTNVPNNTPSTLVLTNTSTNTGPMTINSGTLSIGTAYALSNGVPPVLQYNAANAYPGAFTLGPTATLLTNGFNLTVGSLGGGGPIGGNINLGNNSSSTLYIVQSSSTGYAGIISGTGDVYIVNGGNLAVYGNWTLTGGVTHDVSTLAGNHTDSPQSYFPFATNGSAVTTQGINFAGFTDQVSTIYGGSSGDNSGSGTFVDAVGDGGKLVLSYYAASVANGGPANGFGGTQNFSGFFANDIGLIFDAGYFGNAQQLTLSGPNNTTGPLTIGFTNQTTPQNGAAAGAQSGVTNQVIISAASTFGAVTVGNLAVSNLVNNLTVLAGAGNLTAASVTIGDAFPGSTGNNLVTVGGTLTAGSINIGNTNLYGANLLTILSTGTVKVGGAITIGNDSATGSGTLNVNGALGTTSAPVTSLSVQAGGVLAGYGTITVTNAASNVINVTNGTIRGGFDDGANQLATLTIAASSGATAKAVLTIQGSGSSGLGQTGALMTEVLATGSTAATNSKINITGTNSGLNLNTMNGGGQDSGQFNIVLYDPTASLTPGGAGGATYTFVLATVATAGRIQLGGTNQAAGTVIDTGTTLGAASGTMTNADLYIQGASHSYMIAVTSWSLFIDSTGKNLELSVSSAAPEPEHSLPMCVGVLLAGFAIRRRLRAAHAIS